MGKLVRISMVILSLLCADITGDSVDRCREEKGLPPLKTFVIDVISHNSRRLDVEDVEALKQAKMSSTYIRQWIASRQKRDMGT